MKKVVIPKLMKQLRVLERSKSKTKTQKSLKVIQIAHIHFCFAETNNSKNNINSIGITSSKDTCSALTAGKPPNSGKTECFVPLFIIFIINNINFFIFFLSLIKSLFPFSEDHQSPNEQYSNINLWFRCQFLKCFLCILN